MSQDAEFQQYILALNSLKVEERLNAVDYLCRSNLKAAVPHLKRKLADPDPRVRKTAMRGLALLMGREATPEIVPFLNDPVPDLRIEAMALLVTLSPNEDVCLKILPALKDPVETVRSKATMILTQFPASLVLNPIMELLDDDSPQVRLGALKAIKQLGQQQKTNPPSPSPSPEQIQKSAQGIPLQTPNSTLHPSNADAVQNQAPLPPRQSQMPGQTDSEKKAHRPLGGLFEDFFGEDATRLSTPNQTPSPSRASALSEYALNKTEEPTDIIELDASLEANPAQSAMSNEFEEEEITTSYFIAMDKVESRDEIVRLEGIRELSEVRERERAEQNLISLLLHDPSPTIREEAGRSLGRLKLPASLEALRKALHDAIPKVREAVCEAIRKIGDAKGVLAPTEALKDKERSVRICAIEGLGEIADATVTKTLIPFLDETDPMLRATTIAALGDLKDDQVKDRLFQAFSQETDPLIRVAAAYAISKSGEPNGLTFLLTSLKEGKNILVQVRAAYFLGKLGDRLALPALESAKNSSNRLIKQWASDAILKINAK